VRRRVAGFTGMGSTFLTFMVLVASSLGASPRDDPAGAAMEPSSFVRQQALGPANRQYPRVVWRNSRSFGQPFGGSLANATKLPVEGQHFVTWDPARNRVPSPSWRRYSTGRLIRVLLRVLDEFALAHPDAPRIVIGDLSRRHGGRFGGRSEGMHASHQNGLDVDVYYPRRDRRERAPWKVSDINHELSQDLVGRFVRAGAQYVFVGPRTGLSGPGGVVMTWPNHDNHMHVRLRRG
jgi:murein endopeptidase